MANILFLIILTTLISGLLGLSGAITFLISKKSLDKLIIFLVSLSIGALLGGAFFHFIPEALEKISMSKTIFIIIIGIIVFYLIERILHWHHCHKHGQCEEHPYTHLILYGDAIHNFIDGLIIAGAFLLSIPFGILTSLLIMAHELPQEIGDFGILVYGGFTKNKALFYNFLAQLTAILGGILGYYFLNLYSYAIYFLPFAAGGFIYIAVKDLIPEVFKQKTFKQTIINIIAIILGLLLLVSARVFVG